MLKINCILFFILFACGVIPNTDTMPGYEPARLSSAKVKSITVYVESQNYNEKTNEWQSREITKHGFVTYNETGKPVLISGFGNAQYFSICEYDRAGNQIRETEYDSYDSSIRTTYIREFDEHNRMKKFLAYIKGDSLLYKDESCDFYYKTDTNDNLIEYREFYYNNQNKVTKKFYDTANFLIMEIFSNSLYKDFDTTCFKYFDNGYLSLKSFSPDYSDYFYYDHLNRLKVIEKKTGTKTDSKEIFRYDSLNRLIHKFSLNGKNEKMNEETWEYSEKNLVTTYTSNNFLRRAIIMNENKYPQNIIDINSLPKMNNDTLIIWGKRIEYKNNRDTIFRDWDKPPDKYYYKYEFWE